MPRIEHIQVRNFRILQDIKIGPLAPLSVFLGPNGCGKTTLFQALGFLANCLNTNVRTAIEAQGGFKEVRSRNQCGPIHLELRYRAESDAPLLTYALTIDELRGRPIVAREILKWRRGAHGKPYHFLDFSEGKGTAIQGRGDRPEDERTHQELDDPTILAVKGLGQMAAYPMVADFRKFIEGWHLSYFMPTRAREVPEAGAARHLSPTGDNLPLVTKYLYEEHHEVFNKVLEKLARRIPGLQTVDARPTEDGRVVLRFKDAPFDEPFVARFVSDGTIKMFAYLVLLNDPEPPPLLCIEEPENQLHPRLLAILAEEFRSHSASTQVLVSSHSPSFVNALQPEELWWIQRGKGGYAETTSATKVKGIPEFVEEGLRLGELWMSGHLEGGNP